MNLALLIMSLALLALYLSQCVYLIVSFFVYSFILICFYYYYYCYYYYYYYYYYYFVQNRLLRRSYMTKCHCHFANLFSLHYRKICQMNLVISKILWKTAVLNF